MQGKLVHFLDRQSLVLRVDWAIGCFIGVRVRWLGVEIADRRENVYFPFYHLFSSPLLLFFLW
jgi:hypothetical protein